MPAVASPVIPSDSLSSLNNDQRLKSSYVHERVSIKSTTHEEIESKFTNESERKKKRDPWTSKTSRQHGEFQEKLQLSGTARVR